MDFIVQNRDFLKKFSINYQDTEGNTALHHCVTYNRVESIKILLKANIDVNLKNRSGFSAHQLAHNLKNFKCVHQIEQLLVQNKVDIIEWDGLYEEDNMSDSNDTDFEVRQTKPRPTSMVACKNKLNLTFFGIKFTTF